MPLAETASAGGHSVAHSCGNVIKANLYQLRQMGKNDSPLYDSRHLHDISSDSMPHRVHSQINSGTFGRARPSKTIFAVI